MVGTERFSVPGILSDGDLMGPDFPQELLVLLAAHEGHDAGTGGAGQLYPEVARPSGGPGHEYVAPEQTATLLESVKRSQTRDRQRGRLSERHVLRQLR